MQTKRIGLAWLCTVLAGSAVWVSPAWAQHKCVGANGKVSYQQSPCPDSAASAQDMKPAKPAGPLRLSRESAAAVMRTGAPAAGDTSADQYILPLVSAQSLFETCAPVDPQRYQALLQGWRHRNSAALAQYENSGRYHELLQTASQQAQAQWAAADADLKAQFCKGQAVYMIEQKLGV